MEAERTRHDGWDPSLATGVAVIDEQHREYFARVNRLLSASVGGASRSEVLDVFDFMSAYVTEHFGTEQSLMGQHAYPYRTSHLGQHDWFRKEIEQMRGRLAGVEACDGTVALNALLIDWFRNHIANVDRKLTDHLKSKGVS